MGDSGERISDRRSKPLLWSVFTVLSILVLGARAGPFLTYSGRAFLADGPNTVGEAGKVYFAMKVQAGEWPVGDGRSPPYYPSVHGLLTHASVGLLGSLAGAEGEDLYRLGRFLSLLLTALSLLVLGEVGRRLGVPVAILMWGLLLWLGTYAFMKHAVSYRPDNWLLFLGAVGIWVLSAKELWTGPRVLLLILLPSLAFHIKAPGVAVAGAIVLAVGFYSGWRRAAFMAVAQVGVLASTLLIVQHFTDGAYLTALSGGVGDVGLSLRNSLLALVESTDPVLLLLILAPLPLGWRIFPLARRERGMGLLAVFWAMSLPVSILAALRSGSDVYYFLEAGTYGLLLSLGVLTHWKGKGRGELSDREGRFGRSWVLVVVATLLACPLAVDRITNGVVWDVALVRTALLGETRPVLSRRINGAALNCYTDDPGLNVLLDRPAVIYPLLQHQMMKSGVLEADFLQRAVEERAFDCVVSSGIRWSYRGEGVLPPDFWGAVEVSYPRVEKFGRYEVRFSD